MIKMPRVILLIETSTGYGRQLIHGVARYSRTKGLWLFYCECGSKEKTLPNLEKWGADGIIARDSFRVKSIYSKDIPTIITNTNEPTSGYPQITCDNESTGIMAAEHLLDKGFSQFAYCGFNDTIWGIERSEAFHKRIHEDEYQTHEFMQSRLQVQQYWESQFSALIDWVSSLPLPIAIMCCNDERAHQLIEAVISLGLNIPEEVAIIGADNDRLVCEVTNPPLTSIAFSHEQAGYDAAELLEKMMNGEEVKSQAVITRPVSIVERQSTDTLQISDREIARAHQFIKTHANKGIQVSDVADEVALSRRSLQIRFKKVFRRSVHQEIRLHQVDHVAKLLSESNLPMGRISEMSGFTTSEYMSQVFRKVKGVSLSQYRKKNNQW